MSIHCNAKQGEIEKNVLMPGDPLRAKYIAENFLEDVKLVNTVLNCSRVTFKASTVKTCTGSGSAEHTRA